MARGNERRAIYRDVSDRELFIKTLAEAVETFDLRLHAYCLMSNHYHLLLGTPRGNLSRALAWLQSTYTARFNVRHRRRGHLFQGRYKAQLVEADEYARWLVEYVHLNPVRPTQKTQSLAPERAAELTLYPWSSHRDYGGWRRESPPWLCLDWLAYWGRTMRQARREYRRGIERAFGQSVKSPWGNIRGGLVLGSEELYQKARQLAGQKEGLESARWTRDERADEVRRRVKLLMKDEGDDRVKIWARVRLGGDRGVAVAREYGYADSSGVTRVIRRLESAAATDKHLSRKLEQLRKLSIVND
jgi:REP element-mobilizing transposase RayT